LKNNKVKVTIFIPTYNGGEYLDEVLVAIFKQKVDFSYEVLAIDSGSSDNTLEIIHKFKKIHKNIRLVEIPSSEFGHGKTRNYAAQIASGEYVVYITNDAIPSHSRWLYEIIKPFGLNDRIVGVTGKQIPRQNCPPLLKYEIQSVFANLGPDFGTTIFYKDDFAKDQGTYDAISFYSDVNSAARRDYLVGRFQYKDVAYAEDQLLGREIIDAGYYKVYAPRASVIHSNDLKLSEYRSRMFDEALGLRKLGFTKDVLSKKYIIKLIFYGAIKDCVRIIQDGQLSWKRKIYWFVINPMFHIEKWRGVRLASVVDLRDSITLNKHSLEKKRAK